MIRALYLSIFYVIALPMAIFSQGNTEEEEEDYSMYENVTYSDSKTKVFCNPKIFDLSPQRFISVAWDAQFAHTMQLSEPGLYPPKEFLVYEEAKLKNVGGLRLFANIPVISKNSILWQMGVNYWNVQYAFSDIVQQNATKSVLQEFDRDFHTTGIHTTVFKPLNDKQFLLFQASADLSGNYTLPEFQSLKYTRYSAALLWGKRPNDRKQWAVGLARTYRVGEMNYIPVIMHNWTSPKRTWGTEVLFPARAHVRKNFSSRSLLLGGYELEGQSYRLQGISTDTESIEIRRGELRFRLEYQRQIWGFIWGSFQVGYRHNYSFNADALQNDGKEFFRGFFGDQPYAMLNTLGNTPYINIGIHLVSP